MKKLNKFLATMLMVGACGLFPTSSEAARRQKLNYYYDGNCLFDINDPIGDDKGNGYYQYPIDSRIKRGTYDIKQFRVYEEGDVIAFEITMRNFIMRTWEDTGKTEDQGFVANMWDIYIDTDGLENSGYTCALPGRDLLFADKMGWEKAILISPKNILDVEEVLRETTDDLEFQNMVDDIIVPDYVDIQGNRIIVKIAKKRLPRISENSGFQCFALGYKNIVSSNRLFNRDIKAFATKDDFGGGSNDYGEPTAIDVILPNGEDQYKLLNNFTTAAYRDNIRYADVPFVYGNGNRISPAIQALKRTPMCNTQPVQQVIVQPVCVQPNVSQPVNQQRQMVAPQQNYTVPAQQRAVTPQQVNTVPAQQRTVTPQQVNTVPAQQGYMQQQGYTVPQGYQQYQPQRTNTQTAPAAVRQNNTQNPSGFVPLRQNTQQNPTNVPSGFVPIKKN